MRCLQNLVKVKQNKQTHEDVKFSVEVVLLGFMCGIVMCPGGHAQFQFWYAYMAPILIQMTGLPIAISMWLY